MAIEKYSIGSQVIEIDPPDKVNFIQENRTMIALTLTATRPKKPEILHGLTNIEQVFEKIKPEMPLEFKTEEGTMRKEIIRFRNPGDFGLGIMRQSNILNDLTMKKEQYQKIVRQLKTNKFLQQALANKSSKESIINALQALIMELHEAK